MDLSWRDDASCRGTNPALWFGRDGKGIEADASTLIAVSICRTCPVIDACGNEARERGDFGQVRAGHFIRVPKSARKIRTVNPKEFDPPPPHGSSARYASGCICQACRNGHSAGAHGRRHPEAVSS